MTFNTDIHGHEITFEKTGNLEYSSVYIINCNRKYVIDISSVIVTIREIVIPDKDILYIDGSNVNTKQWNKNRILS
jgi:hypothetical protein